MTYSSSNVNSPDSLSPKTKTVGRFAPSPSGHLHLGSLRTAFAAWLAARSTHGSFYYRVEDTDQGRARPDVIRQQKEDLEWLGLDFDSFGGKAYLQQSSETERYKEELNRLTDRCFTCTCTRKVLMELRTKHHWPDDYHPPQCPPPEPGDNHQSSLRLRPNPGVIQVQDLIKGPVSFTPESSNGPFIVLRGDGFFAYQLVVVLDDIFMGVNQVVRGEDILHATGMQLDLYHSLGAEPPSYAHVPLVLNAHGEKFSKSQGTPDLRYLQARGVTRESILRFLSHTLGLSGSGDSISDPSMLIGTFDFQKIPKESTMVDLQTLTYRIGTGPQFQLKPSSD